MQTVAPALRVGRPLLLARPADRANKVPARPPLEVTLRAISNDADDEAAPFVVTIDDGPCAGMRLWTAEDRLSERPDPVAGRRA